MSLLTGVADPLSAGTVSEELLAELTDAAYRAALQHGLAGNFLEAQLDIWAALRGVLETTNE
jgi:uncharacterized membrane protein